MTPATTSEDVLTVPEVAEYLRVTTKTVYALIQRGALPSFRVGRVLRCRRCDVMNFIEGGIHTARATGSDS